MHCYEVAMYVAMNSLAYFHYVRTTDKLYFCSDVLSVLSYT